MLADHQQHFPGMEYTSTSVLMQRTGQSETPDVVVHRTDN